MLVLVAIVGAAVVQGIGSLKPRKGLSPASDGSVRKGQAFEDVAVAQDIGSSRLRKGLSPASGDLVRNGQVFEDIAV